MHDLPLYIYESFKIHNWLRVDERLSLKERPRGLGINNGVVVKKMTFIFV